MPWKKPGHHVTTKISQDFRTGETVTKDVLKQDLYPAKCVYTVELYDAETGELVQKEVAENRLSAYLINCIYRQLFVENFIWYDENNDSNLTNKNNRVGKIYSPGGVYRSAFSQLLLTDNSKILEDPYDIFVWGNPVGFSDMTRARPGISSRSGMLNTGESYRKIENGKAVRHFVIDFATNQGNGTFQSVYITGPSNLSASGWVDGFLPVYNELVDVPLSEPQSWESPLWGLIPFGDDKYYGNGIPYRMLFTADIIYIYYQGYSNDTTSRYEIRDRSIYPIDRATKTVMAALKLPENVLQVDYDGTYFWALTTDRKIYKLDGKMSVLSTITLPGQFPGKILDNSYCTLGNIAVDNKYIYIVYSGHTTTNTSDKKGALALLVLTKTGVFVKLIYLADTGDQGYSSIRYASYLMFLPNNYLAISSKGWKTFYLDLSTWKFYWWGDFGFHRWYDPYTKYFYGGGSVSFDSTDESGVRPRRYWHNPQMMCPATSHTLLPSPVTKTSANTMKIQYDLVVDNIGFYDKL